jgi:hypothetical protein
MTTTMTTTTTMTRETTMRTDLLPIDGAAIERDVGGLDGVDPPAGCVRGNVNAHSSEARCGTERDKLHGRVDPTPAGRGDGTALHRDTAVNGRAMARIPAERERVLAFSHAPRIAPPRKEAR